MIQVTGYFTTSTNGRYFKDPCLVLIPHLTAVGNMTLDVQITCEDRQVGGMGFEDIDTTMFINSVGNAYTFMINALEDWLIPQMQVYNPDCTFVKIA